MSEHWAFDLIGRPYDLGAGGPDSFDCWGLVRWVFKNVHGIELPMVAVGESGNERAIRSAIDVSGWSPVAGVPRRTISRRWTAPTGNTSALSSL